MLCPKCGKEMKIIALLDLIILNDGSEGSEVLGRCEDCDFDATWERVYKPRVGIFDLDIQEFNFKQYFFG